jgi:hypothetical protein
MSSVAATVVLVAGGVVLVSALLSAGGTSQAAPSRVPAYAPDPTGRPSHARFAYRPPGDTQHMLPPAAPGGGTQPNAGRVVAGGRPYVPNGKPGAPLQPLSRPSAAAAATTWTLYLSGPDLLQPDYGTAAATDQTIGPQLGTACTPAVAGHWGAPPPEPVRLHGPIQGLLHVAASGPRTLQISITSSTLGGSCTVLRTASVDVPGSGAVRFTLARVDVDLPSGVNIGLVVSTTPPARITSTPAAPSYVVMPTAPQ